MLKQRVYYGVKPYTPWPLRMAVRRVFARRLRARHQSTWPIDPAASQPPAGWSGWPDQKRFALVLTHDVEGASGLAKCDSLLELERSGGWRSSFNFVPEGEYNVPAQLRAKIHACGCEVGVHDLHHDGRLFASERAFQAKAGRINNYLREWGARGFRAGFMLRRLDWLHQLEIEYDSSTFDTDPFEPQPDGCGTIFPHWILPRRSTDRGQSGYIELPYTLPQDSTLFLVLQETSIAIWKQKLDWIASQGGMAMVNVHPDYLAFDRRRAPREYPVHYYQEFLDYVRQRYAGQYWNATPAEIARWYRQNHARPEARSTRHLEGRRAAVILYSRYPADPRPRRAAEALTSAGATVDLLCLRSEDEESRTETIKGVNITRVDIAHQRESKLAYLWQYGRFFLAAFRFLAVNGLRHRYDLVHVHNMPDFLTFAALVPKLRGARVILDLHDPMPELMMSIYGLEENDPKVALLRQLEKWSIGFASLAVTPNLAFKQIFDSRSCRPGKMQIVMNTPEETIFDPDRLGELSRAQREPGVLRVMHHGSILHRHGLDLLVHAVALVRREVPGARLDIYGARSPFLESVLTTARSAGIADAVHYHGAKTQSEIAAAIVASDVGVIPNRRTPFTEVNFPTRVFEYLAMQRPVIAPATRGIGDYFATDELLTFTPEDVGELAAKLLWVYRHPAETHEFVRRGLGVYRRHLWRHEKEKFLDLVRNLLERPVVASA